MTTRCAPDAATLRALSVRHLVDPRTIARELRAPGSVRGMTGERARAAVAELAARDAYPTSTPPRAAACPKA